MKKSIIVGVFIILLVAVVFFYYVLITPKSVKPKNDIEKIAYEYYNSKFDQYARDRYTIAGIKEYQENVRNLNIKGDSFELNYILINDDQDKSSLACDVSEKQIPLILVNSDFISKNNCLNLPHRSDTVIKANFLDIKDKAIKRNNENMEIRKGGSFIVNPLSNLENEIVSKELESANFVISDSEIVNVIEFEGYLSKGCYPRFIKIFLKNNKPLSLVTEEGICGD